MQKKSLSIVLLMIVAFCLLPFSSLAAVTQTPKEISITIDGKPIYLDAAPQIIDGRVLVPLRAIFENLGAEVKWDNTTQTATGKQGNTRIVLGLNKNNASINDKIVKLDVPVREIEGRIFVPTRFIAESLGAEVKWDSHQYRITVLTNNRADSMESAGLYYFVYNSNRVTQTDLTAIKLYTNKFKRTHNNSFTSYSLRSIRNDASRAGKTESSCFWRANLRHRGGRTRFFLRA